MLPITLNPFAYCEDCQLDLELMGMVAPTDIDSHEGREALADALKNKSAELEAQGWTADPEEETRMYCGDCARERGLR